MFAKMLDKLLTPPDDEMDLSLPKCFAVLYVAWLIGCVVFGLPTAGVIYMIWRFL